MSARSSPPTLSLHLLCTGLPLPAAAARLARLLGRGRSVTGPEPAGAPGYGPLDAIAHAIGLAASVPWGALALRAGAPLDAPAAGILLAEPVVLSAGMNALSAHRPRTGPLAPPALQALRAVLAPVFADYGATLIVWQDQLLAGFRTALAVSTQPLAAAAALGLHGCLPQGPDAGPLRRLMTECQMVLHADSHPGPLAGDRPPMPTWGEVNGIWLHGSGTLPQPWPAADAAAIQLTGSDARLDWLRCSLAPEGTVATGAGQPERYAQADQQVLCALDDALLPGVLADGHQALWRGQVAALQIQLWAGPDGPFRCWLVRRQDLLAFWRPSLAAWETPA